MKTLRISVLWTLLLAFCALAVPSSGRYAISFARKQATIPVTVNNLNFEGVSGSVTVSGYFVDSNGNQLGNSFTGAVTSASVTNLGALATISGNAAGVIIKVSGNCYWQIGASTTDFAANPSNYPVLYAGQAYPFGRAVAPSSASISGSVSISGVAQVNGATKLNSFGTGESANTVTNSAGALTLGTGNPSNLIYIIVTNGGTVDAWVSPISGGHTWLIPAGSTVYLPVGSTALYGLSTGANTTLYCLGAAY